MRSMFNIFSKSPRDVPVEQVQEDEAKVDDDVPDAVEVEEAVDEAEDSVPPKLKTVRRGLGKISTRYKPGLTIEPVVSKLENFVLYESYSHMFLVGCDQYNTQYRVLKFDRWVSRPTSLQDILVEDTNTYSRAEIFEMLDMIHEGNKQVGGLRTVARGYGLIGLVRFLDCYYINLITQRRKVGKLGGNVLYAVAGTETFPVRRPDGDRANLWNKVNKRLNQSATDIAEARYLSLFQFVDLAKDFYFSYTYDLTRPLQENMRGGGGGGGGGAGAAVPAAAFPPFKDMYAWNHFQLRELGGALGGAGAACWALVLVHGAVLQRRAARFGRELTVTLLARRSRHFAGTRYLKRGVSDGGKVANDVELEQIVHDAGGAREGAFAALVQARGSLPVAWAQETSVARPKPPIVLHRVDPTYAATQAHFQDILARYGAPCLVLDLVRQNERAGREREVIIGREFKKAIEHVNSSMDEEHAIRYCALDFSQLHKNERPPLPAAAAAAAGAAPGAGGVGGGAQGKGKGGHAKGGAGPLLPEGEKGGGAAAAAAAWEGEAPLHRAASSSEALGSLGGPTKAFQALEEVAAWALPQVGLFCSAVPRGSLYEGGTPDESSRGGAPDDGECGPAAAAAAGGGRRPAIPSWQRGVLRTNCVDCLDRTNVAQQAVGIFALGHQLEMLGVPTAGQGSARGGGGGGGGGGGPAAAAAAAGGRDRPAGGLLDPGDEIVGWVVARPGTAPFVCSLGPLLGGARK